MSALTQFHAPQFHAPQYTKVLNPKTGVQDPCYTFQINYNSNSDFLSFVAENQEAISLHAVQKCVLDNIPWWNNFIQLFLQSSTKFFSKPYTVETINKITQHTLNGTIGNKYPINVILVPKNIQICGGVFTVNWGYNLEPMIDIPDVEDVIISLPELVIAPPVLKNKVINDIQELNIDELPVESNNTGMPLGILEIDSPAKFYEKQKVKEARLRAKLAMYKANRQMAQYYEKYGNDISESDTEFETSDEGTEDDSEEAEVS
jgi:hypothetical protein